MSLAVVPLQVVDSFLLNYNVGQAILVLFALSLGVVFYSRRLFALNLTVFGLVFVTTPATLMPTHYLFLGVALVVVGPMLYVMVRE